jgi:hypothetical protein
MREFFTAKSGETRYARDGSAIVLLGNPPEPQPHAKALEVRAGQRHMSRLATRDISSWPKAYRSGKRGERYRYTPSSRDAQYAPRAGRSGGGAPGPNTLAAISVVEALALAATILARGA